MHQFLWWSSHFFVAYQKKVDRASQEQVIEKYSSHLMKLTERIPGYFKEKDIHDWRVEYKKLRAFLRMITASVNGHMPIITAELKKIYRVTGTIREFSLFIAQLNTLPGINREILPVYYTMTEKKLFAAKEEFIKRIDLLSLRRVSPLALRVSRGLCVTRGKCCFSIFTS